MAKCSLLFQHAGLLGVPLDEIRCKLLYRVYLWSGSRAALLTPGPLRTVRARFRAHSSSKPLTRSGAHRLLDGVGLASGFADVDLLVAVQVYQFQVRVRVLAPLRPWFDVVPV